MVSPFQSRAPVSQPIRLEPLFVERIWGSESLAPYYAPVAKTIGEVWLTGNACQVEGTGKTLGDFAAEFPEQLGSGDNAGFPLLLKMLFPREKLSVQVHPNDELARQMLDQPRGKTECWYVLAAAPNAEVALGFLDGITASDVRKAIADGTLEQTLRMLPVKAGDMVFVDAGTVHAIGGGVVMLETQQYSDVTYRLWDYGRPRELHVDDGLRVMRTATQAGIVKPLAERGWDQLLDCEYFEVDRFRLSGGESRGLGNIGSLQVLVALGEGVSVLGQEGSRLPLPPYHAVVLPGGAGAHEIHGEQRADVIRVTAL